jgi:hypothetical protein
MDSKKWYLSKGVWGGGITMVLGVLLVAVAGLDLTEVIDRLGSEQEAINALAVGVLQVVGGFIALWGRLKAKQQIE